MRKRGICYALRFTREMSRFAFSSPAVHNPSMFIHYVNFFLSKKTRRPTRAATLIADCQKYLASIESVKTALGRAAGDDASARWSITATTSASAWSSTMSRVMVSVYQAHHRHDEFIAHNKSHWAKVVLEGVDDARNLGFTLRTPTRWACTRSSSKSTCGISTRWKSPGPASGAYERLRCADRRRRTAQTITAARRGIIGCIAGAKRTLYNVDLTKPTILAIGGEKRGLSGAVRDICDQLHHHPHRRPRGVELVVVARRRDRDGRSDAAAVEEAGVTLPLQPTCREDPSRRSLPDHHNDHTSGAIRRPLWLLRPRQRRRSTPARFSSIRIRGRRL